MSRTTASPIIRPSWGFGLGYAAAKSGDSLLLEEEEADTASPDQIRVLDNLCPGPKLQTNCCYPSSRTLGITSSTHRCQPATLETQSDRRTESPFNALPPDAHLGRGGCFWPSCSVAEDPPTASYLYIWSFVAFRGRSCVSPHVLTSWKSVGMMISAAPALFSPSFFDVVSVIFFSPFSSLDATAGG